MIPGAPSGRRIHATRSDATTMVTIGPARRPFDWALSAILAPAWALSWVALIEMASSAAADPRVTLLPSIFLSLCGLGFLALATWFALALLWRICGREQVKLEGRELVITAILCGVRRARTFSTDGLAGVRVEEQPHRGKGHRFVRRTIGFDYGDRVVRCISQLSPDEGRTVQKLLRETLAAGIREAEARPPE